MLLYLDCTTADDNNEHILVVVYYDDNNEHFNMAGCASATGHVALEGRLLPTTVCERWRARVVGGAQSCRPACRNYAAHRAADGLREVQADREGASVTVGEATDLLPTGTTIGADLQEDRTALARRQTEYCGDVHRVTDQHVTVGARNEVAVEGTACGSLAEGRRYIRRERLEGRVCGVAA